ALVTARVALPAAAAPPTAPLDRHPARIAVPVLLEGYDTEQDDSGLAFRIAGHRLAVDADRAPDAGPLTPEAVAGSGTCIALLRWDGGEFRVQPLAVEKLVRKKPVALQPGAGAGGTAGKAGGRAGKAATTAGAVLRERAGKLLRTRPRTATTTRAGRPSRTTRPTPTTTPARCSTGRCWPGCSTRRSRPRWSRRAWPSSRTSGCRPRCSTREPRSTPWCSATPNWPTSSMGCWHPSPTRTARGTGTRRCDGPPSPP